MIADALQRLRGPGTSAAALFVAVALAGCARPLRSPLTIESAPPPDDEPDGVGASLVYAGARAQRYQTSDGVVEGSAATAGAQGGAEVVALLGKVLVSGGVHGALGVGSRPDGIVAAHAELGRRLLANNGHAMIVRLGVGGRYMASEKLNRATLDTPRLGLGWSMLTNRVLIEISTEFRLPVHSRFGGAGAAERAHEPIGVPGLSAVFQWTPLRVEATYLYTRSTSSGSLNEIYGTACWTPFDPALACINAGYWYGAAVASRTLTAPALQSSVAGISIGIGRMTNGYAFYARDSD